jgi:hypothetical protein
MQNSDKTSGQQAADGRFMPGNKIGGRFPKGASGNSAGRPRLTKITEALREQVSEELPDAPERTIAEAIARKLIKLALGGDIAAIREVLDRTEGKPKQSIDLDIQATSWQEEVRRHGITEAEVAAEARLLLAEFDTGGGGEASN